MRNSYVSCSLHHKAIKYMCINVECKQDRASICDDCLNTTHRHETQEMVQTSSLQDFFSNLRPAERDRITVLRNDFASHFEKYRIELMQIF